MASSSNNIFTIRRHRKDIQQAIRPHLDLVADECFLKRVISSEAYRQVISCADSAALDCLFIAIQRSVTRSAEKYDVFTEVLQDVLPRERSRDLLGKLEATQRKLKSVKESDGVVRRSSSEPIMSLSRPQSIFVTSLSLTERQTTSGGLEPATGERGEENGGLHFSNDLHSGSNTSLVGADDELFVVPVQEYGVNGDVGRERDEFSAAVEERRENEGHPNGLKLRHVGVQSHQNSISQPQVQEIPEASSYGASGIFEAVTCLRHANLECQQRQAQITALNGEVKDLRGQLTSTHEKNEKLILKMQRQLENIESLRRKLHRQISALRDEAQNSERSCERLKTQVAGLEVDRHALREKVRNVTAQYEPRIRELENARSRLQKRIESNEVEIPRLQNVIIKKEKRLQELSQSVCSLRRLIVLFLFFVVLVAFLLWYLLG